MDGLGLDRRLEPIVQLVPEATRAAHRRDVLADPGQVERPVARVVERRGEPLRERRRPREAEHGHDTARKQGLHDLVVDLRRPVVAIRRARAERRVLAQDPRLQLLQAPAGLDAELVDERAARILVGLERLRLASRAVEGLHQQLAWPLAQRLLGDERLELGDDVRRGVRARRRRRSAPRARRGAAPRAGGSRPARSRRRPGRRGPAPARARVPGAASPRAPPVGPCVRPRAAARTALSRPVPPRHAARSPVTGSRARSGRAACAVPRSRSGAHVVAVRGASSPHTSWTRRSVGTICPARRSNAARMARCRRPPSGSGPSSPTTSSGPSSLNSSTARLYHSPLTVV